MSRPLIAAGILAVSAVSSVAAYAQAGGFIDHQRIDARVAAFTGMATGSDNGAAQPVDRRLRLADCNRPLDLNWYGQGQDMVRVGCAGPEPWQIFVPVQRAQPTASFGGAVQQQQTSQIVIERGQVLAIAIEGRGFSVVQQGEALEDGAIGDWIRVRPEGRRDELRARLITPARAVIPLH